MPSHGALSFAAVTRCLTAVLLCGLVQFVQAQDRAVDYVSIKCETSRAVMTIEKHVYVKVADLPKDSWTRSLDRMVGVRPLPRDDAFEFPTNDLVRSCTLGKARYVARVRARVFGSHVLGRCGAAEPGAGVTVTRDGVKLLNDFLMADNCFDTGTSGLDVNRLRLSELASSMTLQATLDNQKESSNMAFDLSYDYASMGDLTLERVWGARPMPPVGGASAPSK
jgi:hypothetical protein